MARWGGGTYLEQDLEASEDELCRLLAGVDKRLNRLLEQ